MPALSPIGLFESIICIVFRQSKNEIVEFQKEEQNSITTLGLSPRSRHWFRFLSPKPRRFSPLSLSLHKFSRRVSYIPHTFLFFFQDAAVKITAKFHWLWNSSRLGQKGHKKTQDILGQVISSLEAVGRSLSGMSSREMAWGVGHWSQFQAWTERYRGTFSPNCYQIQINPHSLKHTLCPIHKSALCSSGTHEIGLRNRNSNRSFQKSIPFSVHPWKLFYSEWAMNYWAMIIMVER